MAMTKWDQDIHRIQEIQQLLETRQRYFRGHLETPTKLGLAGSSLPYPKLSSYKRNPSSNEPSAGHSLDANPGSIDSPSVSDIGNNDDLSLQMIIPAATEKKHGKTDALPDSSDDGNCADHSQNESSDTNGSDFKGAAKKTKKKSAKVLRKWVTKNVEMASASPPVQNKFSINNAAVNMSSRKASIIRFQSTSIDKEPTNANTTTTMSNKARNSVIIGNATPTTVLHSKKKKAPNPVKLLRRRSWILKAEMASRLNEDMGAMKLNKVITTLSKSSISHAREKLKKAEKSLRATVKNEQKIPGFKKKKQKQEDVVPAPTSKPVLPKPTHINRPALSRLLLRQKEDALKSDLNLREAFAMIKIDPDPLLQLASTEENSNKTRQGEKSVSGLKKQVAITLQKSENNGKETDAVVADDTRTTLSLQRLTKLSIQHSQMQQCLIPTTVQPCHTQKEKKELNQQLQQLLGKNVKPCNKRDTSSSRPFEASRRKGSTASSSGQQKANNANFKRRSQDRRTSIVPLSRLPGDIRTVKAEGEHNAGYVLDRLEGTII